MKKTEYQGYCFKQFSRLFFTTLTLFIFHSSIVSAQSWLWAKEALPLSGLGDPQGDHCVATDKSGNVFLTGLFQGSLVFGADTINSVSDDAFLTKYDSNGNILWARQGNCNSNYSFGVSYSCATDSYRNSFIAGYFGDTITFGANRLINNGAWGDAFLVKYNPNGNVLWARQTSISIKNASSACVNSVSSDISGNVYISGYFEDTVAFGPFTLLSQSKGAFLVKYDANGNVIWAKQSLQPKNSLANSNSIAIDANCNIYITGWFTNTVNFGAFTLTGNASYGNVFTAKYDSGGNILWAGQSSPSNSGGVGGNSVSVDGLGNAYITGQFTSTLSFGSFNLSTPNSSISNLFLVKYSSGGNVIWAEQANVFDNNDWYGESVACDTLKSGGGYLVFTADYAGGGNGGIYNISIGGDTLLAHYPYATATILVRFDSLGNVNCGSTFCEGGEDDADGIAVDKASKHVFLGGDIDDSTTLGNCTLPYGNDAPFVASWQPCTCSAFVNACCNGTITSGSSLVLNATLASNYSWSPAAGLSCTNCQSPLASPTVTTEYYVTVTDGGGCFATDSVLVTVAAEKKCGAVFIPDVFSPNGDGQNDVLYVRGDCINTLDFSIYDRWGNKIFESGNINNGWDGTFNGHPMNTGTYAYNLLALLQNGNTIEKHGNITLVR